MIRNTKFVVYAKHNVYMVDVQVDVDVDVDVDIDIDDKPL